MRHGYWVYSEIPSFSCNPLSKGKSTYYCFTVLTLTPLPFSLFYLPLLPLPGVTQEKIATFLKRLRAEPRYLLAQNVSTCIDPLEVCLHRQTVQDTVHIFQHSIPTEGKPITNQKNSGDTYFTLTNVICFKVTTSGLLLVSS